MYLLFLTANIRFLYETTKFLKEFLLQVQIPRRFYSQRYVIANCTRQFESQLSLRSLAKSLAKRRVFRKSPRPSLPLKKETFLPLRLSCKESSTFLTKPLFPQGREDVTALRCSEPLRYKVGGASKPSPNCAGWDRRGTTCYNLLVETTIFAPHCSIALHLSSLE